MRIVHEMADEKNEGKKKHRARKVLREEEKDDLLRNAAYLRAVASSMWYANQVLSE